MENEEVGNDYDNQSEKNKKPKEKKQVVKKPKEDFD